MFTDESLTKGVSPRWCVCGRNPLQSSGTRLDCPPEISGGRWFSKLLNYLIISVFYGFYDYGLWVMVITWLSHVIPVITGLAIWSRFASHVYIYTLSLAAQFELSHRQETPFPWWWPLRRCVGNRHREAELAPGDEVRRSHAEDTHDVSFWANWIILQYSSLVHYPVPMNGTG